MELHLVLLSLLFSTLLFLSLLPAGTSDLAADTAALLRLRSAVRGNTLRWNQSDPLAPCSWSGVVCNNNTINRRVTELRLPGDGLVGQIPESSIGNLTQLQTLSLRYNYLSGQLPQDLGSCTELRLLNLQGNNFSGQVEVLFRLNNLNVVDLSRNSFAGEISTRVNNLTQLRVFNVSFNRLNGQIPPALAFFSASYFIGNELCGSPLDSCPNNNSLSAGAIAGIVVGSVFGSFLLVAILFLLLRKRRSSSPRNTPRVEMSSIPPSPVKPPENPITVMEYAGSGNGYSGRGREVKDLVFFGEGIGGFNLEDLLRASAEVLGKGTCGTTYKAYLEDGGEVIVKRLKNVCVTEEEFRDKVERLGELVHENVVPLRGYYYGWEEKLVVFDSMPMGSLSAILHGNNGANRAALTWEMRSTIAFQIAAGVEYLHFLGVTHGNIKSSNVLLTDRYNACISEFGIAQLVSSTTPNLIGYRAPEVVDTRKVSQKSDVYSFGVLILELLTCKVPTDTMNDDGVDLPKWVRSVVEEKWTIDVFHPELQYENIREQVVQLLHLGIHCTAQHPDKRPSMVEAMAQIKRICRPSQVS